MTRSVFAEAPPPDSDDLRLWRLEDAEMSAAAHAVARARDAERHFVEVADWAARLTEAARHARPREHEAMPEAFWRAVTERRGGALDRNGWRYVRHTPGGTLSLGLRWAPSRGYHLQGEIRWPPLPVERLKLSLEVSQSWFRRLLLRDVEVGDPAFDQAFLVDADRDPARLGELLTAGVRRGLVELAAHTEGLAVDRNGATFLVAPLPVEAADLDPILEAAHLVVEGLRAARAPSRGAYR